MSSGQSRRKRVRPAMLAGGIALGCCAVAMPGCGGAGTASSPTAVSHPPQTRFDGAALSAPVAAPPFTLADADGHSVSLHSFRGHVLILAFLNPTCRACIVIAQQIRGALDELAKPPAVLFVSVDPLTDSPAQIEAFLRRTGLSDRAHYLVGPPAALAAVLHDYRVVTPARGQAAFEAAATVYLLDQQGRERVLYQQEQLTPEALAHDVRVLQGD